MSPYSTFFVCFLRAILDKFHDADTFGRSAVEKAARRTLSDGRARLIRIQPRGEGEAAVQDPEVHLSSCPSGGTVDVFVEPMLPPPRLIIMGGSPAGRALSDLARRVGFAITVATPATEQKGFVEWIGGSKASISARSRLRDQASSSSPHRAGATGQLWARRFARRALRRLHRESPQGGGPEGGWSRTARRRTGSRACAHLPGSTLAPPRRRSRLPSSPT
jgi:hypothetical protein